VENRPRVQQKLFTVGELRLNYAVFGEGDQPVLAFHGFGRTHEDFIRFSRPFQDKYTFYAFDIFFHGKSHIGDRLVDEEPLTKEELGGVFTQFLEKENLKKVALMGYSLGGRICLCLAEVIAPKISALYLFAPDGLVLNRWYAMLSHYSIGRFAFRQFIRYNKPFYWILNGLRASKVISQNTYVFVSSQIETREMQLQVYAVWVFLRKIESDFENLERSVGEKPITFDLFFGIYDKIIPEKNAKKLKRSRLDVNIHNLRSGHILLTAANGELLKREGLLRLPA
jgi:pimeloyl-ACP methyl ester carboxylesterase